MANAGSQLDSSFQFSAVTTSDTATLSYTDADSNTQVRRCKGIYVGVSGDVVVKDDAGTSVTFKDLANGIIHPISTDRIMATGTTATNIVCLF